MSRPPRIDFPDALYHVTNRGSGLTSSSATMTGSGSSASCAPPAPYSSYMCSPPCAGLATRHCILGSMTKSRSSNGTCPMSTGQSSETSMTSTRQSRSSMVNGRSVNLNRFAYGAGAHAAGAKGRESELLDQALGHGERGGACIHKSVWDLQTSYQIRREQASLGVAQVVGVFDRCPYGHCPIVPVSINPSLARVQRRSLPTTILSENSGKTQGGSKNPRRTANSAL